MHKEEEAKRAASPPTSRSPETARLLYDAFIALHRATASKLPLPTFTPSKGDDASAEISLLLQAFKTLLASLPQERITLIEAETRLNAMREAHAADHARHAVELARERNRITKYEASIRELEQKLAVMTSRSNATSRWASTMAPPMSWRAREPGATWVGATAAPTLLGGGQVAAMRHLGAMVTRLADEQKEVVEQQGTPSLILLDVETLI